MSSYIEIHADNIFDILIQDSYVETHADNIKINVHLSIDSSTIDMFADNILPSGEQLLDIHDSYVETHADNVITWQPLYIDNGIIPFFADNIRIRAIVHADDSFVDLFFITPDIFEYSQEYYNDQVTSLVSSVAPYSNSIHPLVSSLASYSLRSLVQDYSEDLYSSPKIVQDYSEDAYRDGVIVQDYSVELYASTIFIQDYSEDLYASTIFIQDYSEDAYRDGVIVQDYSEDAYKDGIVVYDYSEDLYASTIFVQDYSEDAYRDGIMIHSYSAELYASTIFVQDYSEDAYKDGIVVYDYSEDSYGSRHILFNASDDTYSLLIQTLVESISPFSIIDGTVVMEYDETSYDLIANYKILDQSYDYWILESDAIIGTDPSTTVSFKLNGEDIPNHSISDVHIYCGKDQYCMSVDVTLNDITVFNQFTYRSILEVSTEFDTFTFIIDNRRRNREFGSISMTITGTSLTADLGEPFASRITKIFESDLVSDIAKELALPFTLEWNTVDWIMPDNILSVVDQTSIEIIKVLASTCGAVVLTTPDNILKVVSKYPINPVDWVDSAVAAEISDSLDIISQDEVDLVNPGYNRVYLSNQEIIENERVTIDELEISDKIKHLHIFSVPFNNFLELKTSGSPHITTSFIEIKTEELTEIIEFVNGRGRTSKPMYDILTYSWQYDSLGTLTFSEDGQITSLVPEHSLLEITYNTKYHLYEVSSPDVEKVQFYVL